MEAKTCNWCENEVTEYRLVNPPTESGDVEGLVRCAKCDRTDAEVYISRRSAPKFGHIGFDDGREPTEEDKKFLEVLGVLVGPYDTDLRAFDNCTVYPEVLKLLKPYWANPYVWVLSEHY